jgi:mono/diheme cytochrome c family protein
VRAALLALAAAALAAAAGCDDDRSFARMKEQSRYEAYEPGDFFPDGATMQPPPAGTVPSGGDGAPRIVREGMEGGRYAQDLPVPLTFGLLARGRERYEIYCAACHGLLGDGNTVVAARMRLRPPPSLWSFGRERPPGSIFRVITEGYGLMPSYAPEVGIADRWAIVAYVRALALSQTMKVSELPAGLRDEMGRALK